MAGGDQEGTETGRPCSCPATLADLTVGEVALALQGLDDRGLRRVFGLLHTRPGPALRRHRAPEVVAGRLPTLPRPAAHSMARVLARPVWPAMVARLEPGGATGTPAVRWPAGLVRLVLAILEEEAVPPGPEAPPDPENGEPDRPADESAGPAPPMPGRVLDDAGVEVGPLDRLVLEAVAVAGRAGRAGAPELGVTVAQLVRVDGGRAPPWFVVGLLAGYAGTGGEDPPRPASAELAYFRHLGRLTALVERGDGDGVVAACADRPATERVVSSGEAAQLGAGVLAVLLGPDPGWVATLLGRLTVSLAGWPGLLAAIRAGADALLAAGAPSSAEELLAAADEVVAFWRGLEPDPREGLALEREHALLRMRRAACRRAAGDMTGAEAILEELPLHLLDDGERPDR